METQTAFMRRVFTLVSNSQANTIPLSGRFKELAWDNQAIQFGHPGTSDIGGIEWEIHFYEDPELLCMTFSSADGDAGITLCKDRATLQFVKERLVLAMHSCFENPNVEQE